MTIAIKGKIFKSLPYRSEIISGNVKVKVKSQVPKTIEEEKIEF